MFRLLVALLLLTPSSLNAAFPIHGTFLNFYRNLTPELLALEFRYMASDGIDTVVIESVGQLAANSSRPLSCALSASQSYTDSSGYALAPAGLLYPSAFVGSSQRPSVDLLETVLELADAAGMNVYIGSLQTAADWTSGAAFCALREINRQVASEIVGHYGGHASFKGWYFTQEIWMNWVKYYGEQAGGTADSYYGTNLLAQWTRDMKSIDSTRLTSAAVVFKEWGTGVMPGLSAFELQQWTTSLLETAPLDVFMPQDGAGAEAGAPPISDLPAYFAAMANGVQAAGHNALLWSTLELFTASSDANLSGEQYKPVADVSRIEAQIAAVSPFVSGYMSWIFGDDLSPQAAFYPVEASELNRRYSNAFNPQSLPADDVLTFETYWYASQQPDSRYPDSASAPLLSDGTGGGYNITQPLASWVGFSDPSDSATVLQIVADLGSSHTIHTVQALTQSSTQSGILHPSDMLVETSQDGFTWSLFGNITKFPSDTPSFAVMWGEVEGAAIGRFVRFTFDYSQWLFLAELQVIGQK